MLAVILCCLLIGAILAIVAQALLLRKWFFSLPVTGPPKRSQFDRFSLPKVRSRKLLNIYTNNLNDMILLLPPLLVNDGLNFFFQCLQEIQDALLDPELKKKKETCLCVNLIFQFLFNELKDTKRTRRQVIILLVLKSEGASMFAILEREGIAIFSLFIWHLLKKIRDKLVKLDTHKLNFYTYFGYHQCVHYTKNNLEGCSNCHLGHAVRGT